jgi:hypothetical protein
MPELEAAVQAGKISVTTVGQVQAFLRKEKSSRTPEQKRELFTRMEGKSSREVERELIAISPAAAMPASREKALTTELTEIRFVADRETMDLLAQARSELSHQLEDPNSYAELIRLMAIEAAEAGGEVTFGAETDQRWPVCPGGGEARGMEDGGGQMHL